MTVAVTPGVGPDLARQLAALERVIALCEGRLDDDALATARGVLVQAEQRLRLSGAHTVVALAGPTGSGKSSLFNAIAELPLSRVGVRRPTTSQTLACVWGLDGAQPLLDWLKIPRARQLSRETVLDVGSQVDLSGLVLLDLPDYDSIEADHQIEVDRLLDLVDVMVWVFDPEKYADALAHQDYLRALAAHAPITICVFNQVDRLEAGAVRECIVDLRRLLVEDGLGQVDVVAASATTGLGVTELRRLVAARAMRRHAAGQRLRADVVAIAGDLSAVCGDGRVSAIESTDIDVLAGTLCEAAGVSATAEAVADAYGDRAAVATGWRLVRWLRGRSPIPGLMPQPARVVPVQRSAPMVSQHRVRGIARSTVAEPEVQTALRSIADIAAAGMPVPWADAVRRAARDRATELVDALERVVVETVPTVRSRSWWLSVGALQWVFVAVTVFGAGWLLALAGFAIFGISDPPAREIAGWPVPAFLLVVGAACGAVLSAVCRPFIAFSTVRMRRTVKAELSAGVAQVAIRVVVDPVRAEQERYATVVEQLTIAATPAARPSG